MIDNVVAFQPIVKNRADAEALAVADGQMIVNIVPGEKGLYVDMDGQRQLLVGEGTAVDIAGVLQPAIGFSSDPQTQLNAIDEKVGDLWKYFYQIGSLHISTNPKSPAEFIGGVWEKLTADAYLKIVQDNAGILAGTSSQHKIPITSMPQHNHSVKVGYGGLNNSNIMNETATAATFNTNKEMTQTAGNGVSYYPYYYGVYVWKRIS